MVCRDLTHGFFEPDPDVCELGISAVSVEVRRHRQLHRLQLQHHDQQYQWPQRASSTNTTVIAITTTTRAITRRKSSDCPSRVFSFTSREFLKMPNDCSLLALSAAQCHSPMPSSFGGETPHTATVDEHVTSRVK
ncbi:hypothetical protein KIN20_032729 [Parelaphostrongylus tenuis]|uniref:Uncharacterized protein n=1 Tax=Parelaphostrongylus tenuis TaxID=148309 RepID=A0AAD5R7L7_PARTN|nr:hypothetical protein KIN20_032729 [Parelaphostrongylus tenuis]